MSRSDVAKLLDHPLIAERYFHPFQVTPREPFWVDVPSARLACVHYAPHGPDAPTLVHFHGNGEVVSDYVPEVVQIFAAFGWNTFLAEYRGYGGSTGVPQLGQMLDDVPALLAAPGCRPERMVVFGRSVGSLFAAEAVRCAPRIAGLVLDSGIADPLERLVLRVRPEELGATRAELAEAVAIRLDQQAKLKAYRGRILIMHARHDDLVPVHHAERLYRWGGAHATLEIMPEGDHNTIMAANAETYFKRLAEFLDEVRERF